MLGDNLYDDDYDGEFSVPYKPLRRRREILRGAAITTAISKSTSSRST